RAAWHERLEQLADSSSSLVNWNRSADFREIIVYELLHVGIQQTRRNDYELLPQPSAIGPPGAICVSGNLLRGQSSSIGKTRRHSRKRLRRLRGVDHA